MSRQHEVVVEQLQETLRGVQERAAQAELEDLTHRTRHAVALDEAREEVHCISMLAFTH